MSVNPSVRRKPGNTLRWRDSDIKFLFREDVGFYTKRNLSATKSRGFFTQTDANHAFFGRIGFLELMDFRIVHHLMPATTETIKTVDHKPHAAFFRQSGWLMIANIGGGLMTFGVHFLNKKIPDSEYSAFGVLLMLVACLPTMPFQMP